MGCHYCTNGVAPFYEIKEVHAGSGQTTGRSTTMCHTCKALGKEPVFEPQGVESSAVVQGLASSPSSLPESREDAASRSSRDPRSDVKRRSSKDASSAGVQQRTDAGIRDADA